MYTQKCFLGFKEQYELDENSFKYVDYATNGLRTITGDTRL